MGDPPTLLRPSLLLVQSSEAAGIRQHNAQVRCRLAEHGDLPTVDWSLKVADRLPPLDAA